MQPHRVLWAGVLAPVVYGATVVLGGALWPGYSHLGQPVSDLLAVGAPNRHLLNFLFAFYNLLVCAFGLGLRHCLRRTGPLPGRALGLAGAWVLIAESVFGLATLLCPEDPPLSAISLTGMLHIVCAGLSSLTTMLAMLLIGRWLGHRPGGRGSRRYSFVSLGFVLLTGALAAVAVARQLPVGGLLERLTIGGFLQWLLVISLRLLATEALHHPSPA